MKPKNPITLLIGWLAFALQPIHAASAVESATAGATNASGGSSSSQNIATSAAKKDEAVMLSTFQVTGEKDEGYRSTQTVSGSRTIESLRDVPNSISIMNHELINDLNATTVSELTAFGITGEVSDNTASTIATYVFRGIVSTTPLRNGIVWFSPLDTYSIERVELLRGPSAFLYGEGTAGGTMNQLTKQAVSYNFNKLNFMVGSYNMYRGELDVNRKLTDKLALRVNLAYQNSNSFVDHTKRAFKGIYLASSYSPFKNTNINVNLEAGKIREIRAAPILADAFSTTERTGAASTYSNTVGGLTLLPATGKLINTVGTRRSSGTSMIVTDKTLLPSELNFFGPNSFHNVDYMAANINIEQKIGENLTIQASLARQQIVRNTRTNAGSSSAGIYLDTNPTMPGGDTNPYFNQYYTEYFIRRRWIEEPINDARATLVYDLQLPFTKQRIIASGTYHDDAPQGYWNSEFVDSNNSAFSGALINANTLAAYQANVTTLRRNYFYRRAYIKDGDGSQITDGKTVPGLSVMRRDPVTAGSSGRQVYPGGYKTPAYGIGMSGSYFKGRLHSLVGWRHDSFVQTTEQIFYNPVTGDEYQVPESPRTPRLTISKKSYNVGIVAHPTDFVSAYFNYAQSVGLSSGIGGAGLIPGSVRGVSAGDGYESGLRWSLFDGRVESNWTYYISNVLNQSASPAIPQAAMNELSALFTNINPNGGDTQQVKTAGVEFETVANLTTNWRLTWNLSTNKLQTSKRFPALHGFQAAAKAQNSAIPQTDSFLSTVPDGTPVPGFTKTRSNLVTNYQFSTGPLKNISIGGGFQYRTKAYRGNFDLNRDGTAEMLWSPAYFLGNLIVGYRTKIMNRAMYLNLTLNNIFDKGYYRSYGLGSGAWGEGRNFRLSIRTEF